MVHIDHTALYVRDLEGSKEFFLKYFGGESNELYHNPTTDLKTYFLTFDGGSRLEIMSRPGHEESPQPTSAGWNHLAFSLGSKEAVDQLAKTLRADGLEIISGPRTTGDGYYECAFYDPEGNQIEITA